ncbi:hypothetical protein [Streptomyces cyaneofuscatus]|uniref:Lipoprotein n=1 Tax=Streptomyces cyaneofuscatus TaxID=66883 RepID=A0ABZ1F1S7_9ACTN|nr:hypothetical protein [Streptomyces cyaneofuscatus]WSB10376.1 hypothetical protein OG849_25600 [Streptomyces cyaneofuscatus]WSD46091.1 hypothetical protein OG857_09800 [Streptomyces cyaneofuscatus]
MRPVRVPAVASAVAALALVSGCGAAGGLESAGEAPSAVEPARLWPDLPPASAAPYDYGEGETARIPGITVPGGDVHRLDPVAVAQAGLKAKTDRDSGLDELPDVTVRQIRACRTAPDDCPVLAPYYFDLTGDGRDELVLGIRMPERQLAVRAYRADGGGRGEEGDRADEGDRVGLTRIMSTSDAVISVELAGKDLILRAPSVISGYEYRTAWSWDDRQQAMLATRDEILRVPERRTDRTAPTPKSSGSAAPTPKSSGSAAPTPDSSGSPADGR